MLTSIAYGSHNDRSVNAMGFNILLCTVVAMFVDFFKCQYQGSGVWPSTGLSLLKV